MQPEKKTKPTEMENKLWYSMVNLYLQASILRTVFFLRDQNIPLDIPKMRGLLDDHVQY